MNHIQNLLRTTIIAILALFAFGSPQTSQAAQTETDQFSCTNVTEIPQIECEAISHINANQFNSVTTQIVQLKNLTTSWLDNNSSRSIPASTQIMSPARPAGDEPNDSCDQASTIVVNGTAHDYAFQTQGDVDWLRVELTAGGEYRLDITIPHDSLADVEPKLYAGCDTLPTDGLWRGTFGPGARLFISPDERGPIYLRLTNRDSTTHGDEVNYQVTIREFSATPQSRAAIIIAGLYKRNDPLQNNIHYVTDQAFALFQNFGYRDNDIYYLVNDRNISQRDADATLQNVRLVITQWAKDRLEPGGVLNLYIVDHGDEDRIYINGPQNDVLNSMDLDIWLSELEDEHSGLKVNIFIEASHAGSFIEGEQSISKEGRVVVTSSDVDWVAYASDKGAYFSDHLLTNLRQGYTLFNSFWETSGTVKSLFSRQKPWLDADGDKIPNQPNDFAIASEMIPSNANIFSDNDDWAPFIVQVNQPTVEGQQGTIQATVRDDARIEEVWAVIYPPSYEPPTDSQKELMQETLQTLQLTSIGSDTYTVDYGAFNEEGAYRIVVHAEDNQGMVAQPVDITLTAENSDTPTPTEIPTIKPMPTATNIPRPTVTPTQLPPNSDPGDTYESNDECILARQVATNGLPQNHSFHTPGDTDWSFFTAPAAGTYRIEVTIPDGSPADIDLYYYLDCDDPFQKGKFTGTFAPGVSLDVVADRADQRFYIKSKNYDRLVAGPQAAYNISVRQLTQQKDDDGTLIVPGPAIVVAGSYRDGDLLQPNINQSAEAAYDFFAQNGRHPSEIFFLANDSGLSGSKVDGEATLRNLEYGITTWAKEQLDKENVSQILNLYLVDHGGLDKFYLDRVNEEVLTSDQLHDWLLKLEADVPGLWVNVIIEACKSGSFIDQRAGSISKENRIIITSANSTYDAYASLYGARFTENFISFLRQGRNLGYSFDASSNIVQKHNQNQEPWLDANGNGIANENNDIAIASLRSTASWDFGSRWPPYIASTEIMSARSGDGLRLQAEVRHENGKAAIKKVWGVVYPPDYVHPNGEPDYTEEGELLRPQLEIIEFDADESGDVLFVTEKINFSQLGRYQVAIHAQDIDGLEARPVVVEVTDSYMIYLPMISR